MPRGFRPLSCQALTGHLAIAGRHAQFDHASCHRQTSRPALPVHLVVVVVSGSGVLPASTNNSRPFIGPRAYSFTDGRLSEAIFAGSRGTLVWCEPVDLLVGVRERPSSRARGGLGVVRARGFVGWCAWEAVFAGSRGLWGSSSPGECCLVCVGGHLRGLAGALGWCEPGDLLVGVRGRPSLRARNYRLGGCCMSLSVPGGTERLY